MVEVNPLAETPDGRVLCADAKLNFDDNAEFRQDEIFAMRDISQEDPRDVGASKYDLNYIGLDGNIACMVNGAGLAMSTMDIISLYGGSPANFLDVGGSADGDQMTEAIKILNSDEEVKAIFVNIFGGILQCDMLTQSIISAGEKIGLDKPIVLRLKGTNSDIAKKMLEGKSEKLGIFYEEDFDTAAQKVVKLV